MPLDPPLQRIADLLAAAGDDAPEPTDLDERRQAANTTMLLLAAERDAAIEVTEHEIPVDGGTITVRVLDPTDVDGPKPGLLFIHGGGWFQGNLDTAEVECGPLASLVGCVVVSVGYRLAPEHPFPIPLDDCTAAYEWLLAHLDELGIDPERIAFAGTSAGGNLAAALTLVARDRGLPQPLVQLLDVPALDLTLASPSMVEQGSNGGLTRDLVDEYAGYYVGPDGDRDPPARLAAARAGPLGPRAGGGGGRRARPRPRRRRAVGRGAARRRRPRRLLPRGRAVPRRLGHPPHRHVRARRGPPSQRPPSSLRRHPRPRPPVLSHRSDRSCTPLPP